jgi:integrase
VSRGFKHLRVPNLKEQNRIPETFSADDIGKLPRWRPRTPAQQRLQSLLLLLSDTWARIDESLSLTWADLDFDNQLLLYHGKGRKDRGSLHPRIRRYLYKWRRKFQTGTFVFPSRNGNKLGCRDALRHTKNLCRDLRVTVRARTLHAGRATRPELSRADQGPGVVVTDPLGL